MDKEDFEQRLADLEVRLERLRSLYEQYFIGIEKIEPGVARKDVDRRFWELRKVRVRNTAVRFRFQTLIQRYNTLQQYWMRICREIENGTYVRHLRRAARMTDARPVPDSVGTQPLATSPDGDVRALAEPHIATLHAALLDARAKLQQGGISVEAVAERVRSAKAQLERQYPGRTVDFRVEVRDGKAVIKPFFR